MKIVQLPRKVWVGSYEFPVHLVAPNDPRLDEDDGAMLSGTEVDGVAEFSIVLSNTMGTLRRLEIFKHEIIHAINWVDQIEDGVEEEVIAAKHGRAWAQFYLDNPKYVSWLVYTLAKVRRDRRANDDAQETHDTKKPATPRDSGSPVQAGGEAGPHEMGGSVRGSEKA